MMVKAADRQANPAAMSDTKRIAPDFFLKMV
jgi:hypothetical protein